MPRATRIRKPTGKNDIVKWWRRNRTDVRNGSTGSSARVRLIGGSSSCFRERHFLRAPGKINSCGTFLIVRRLSFRKNLHLRKGADFARVYALRCVARGSHLTVFAAPNQSDALRVGLSVSKKHGNAV